MQPIANPRQSAHAEEHGRTIPALPTGAGTVLLVGAMTTMDEPRAS